MYKNCKNTQYFAVMLIVFRHVREKLVNSGCPEGEELSAWKVT